MGEDEDAGGCGKASTSERESLSYGNHRTGVGASPPRIDTNDRPSSPLEQCEILAPTTPDVNESTAGWPKQLVGKAAISGVKVRMDVDLRGGSRQDPSPQPQPNGKEEGPREQSHGVAGKDTGGEPVEPEEREERPKQREQEEEPLGRSLQQG